MNLLNKKSPARLPFADNPKKFFFILTVLFGLAFLFPQLDFQAFLVQGDHGRDLYCFKKTMDGALPYRDYSWVLGPLMPYYYALVFKLFGATVQSAALGQSILVLLTGMIFFAICATFLSPAMSFTCALVYWAFRGADFFYTYVHIGGVLSLLLVIYFLFRYFRRPQVRYVLGGTLAIISLMLVRLNIGAIALLIFFFFLSLADQNKSDRLRVQKRGVYFFLTLSILSIVFLIYGSLLGPLPKYVINQSLPYLKSQRTDVALNFSQSLEALKYFLLEKFWGTLASKIASVLLLLVTLQAAIFIAGKKLPKEEKTNLLLAINALFLIGLLNLHEFIASGIMYRLLWTIPIFLILIFYLLDIGTRGLSVKWVRPLLLLALLLPTLGKIIERNLAVDALKKPGFLFSVGENRIYTTQPADWVQVVTATTAYIQKNVPPEEGIFALPFEPLYYFLTKRDSPTSQLIFFEHVQIPPEQEKQIIADLEKHNVTHIILSNRAAYPTQPGLGILGKDYCPLLAKYISDNYKMVTVFGIWNQPAQWATGHAVKIFKRISRGENPHP